MSHLDQYYDLNIRNFDFLNDFKILIFFGKIWKIPIILDFLKKKLKFFWHFLSSNFQYLGPKRWIIFFEIFALCHTAQLLFTTGTHPPYFVLVFNLLRNCRWGIKIWIISVRMTYKTSIFIDLGGSPCAGNSWFSSVKWFSLWIFLIEIFYQNFKVCI